MIERTAEEWDGLEDEYLRARAADLRSVGRQVLARLLDRADPAPALEAPGVVIASDLSPADTVGLDPSRRPRDRHRRRRTHVARRGARARRRGSRPWSAPAMRCSIWPRGPRSSWMGPTGVIHVDPDVSLAGGADRRARRTGGRPSARRRTPPSEPARTIDGTTIEVAANIGSPADAVRAVAAGADGVGLFRTEFLFMSRSSMPDGREQEAAYRETAEALGGRPLVIRTLDAGADKPLPIPRPASEPNPFLGVRGIRLGLERPELLQTQLQRSSRWPPTIRCG